MRDWLSSQLPAIHIAEVRKGYAPFTKNKLKAERRTQVSSHSSRGLGSVANASKVVRSVDPDAESRGEGKWDLEDVNYSKALHRTLFEYARSGQLEAAFDLARQADQPWRAASLRGAMLYHRPYLSGNSDGEDDMRDGESDAFIGGNRNRVLWKAVCKRLAANNSLEPYERALYGCLAGHLQAVLAVSSQESWEEHLWAHVNASLENRIEAAFERQSEAGAGEWWSQESDGGTNGVVKLIELKTATTTSSSAKTDVPTELRDIFSGLKGSGSAGVASAALRLQSDDPYRLVQRAIILDELPDLFVQVEARLDEMRAAIPPKRYAHLCRFFAHLVLYLRLLGRDELPAVPCNSILRHYVEVLEHVAEASPEDAAAMGIMNSSGELIAMYASSLEKESAEESYAHYLKSLNERVGLEEKKDALIRAQNHDLDTASVARLVVQVIFAESYSSLQQHSAAVAHHQQFTSDRSDSLLAGSGGVDLTSAEERLIKSLEWLYFLEGTRSDALIQSNALMRAFLSRGRVHAARALLLNLPQGLSGVSGGGDEVDEELDGAARVTPSDRTEHAHWYLFFEALSSHLGGVELLSQQPSSISAKRTELHGWRVALVDATLRARDATRDVLVGDWLKLPSDALEEEDEDDVDGAILAETRESEERRQVELARIRQIFVPELVTRIHFLLLDVHQALSSQPSSSHAQTASTALDDSIRSLIDWITADLPILVADERYKVYLDFVQPSSTAADADASAIGGGRVLNPAAMRQQHKKMFGSGGGEGGGEGNRLKDYLMHVREAYLYRMGLPEFAAAGQDPFAGW